MEYKRILTVQDISCVGQCSITVALPILSVCGHETAILPSSVLSNHTTGFSGYTFRDLSEDMPFIREQWLKENIDFSAVYTGYMGNEKQIEYVLDIYDSVLKAGGVIITDPAMADNGLLYPGFDEKFVLAMKKMCSRADYILPNITEACMLTDTEYTEKYDEKFIKDLMEKLCRTGCRNVIVTGVSYDEETTGAAIYENGRYSYYCHEKLPKGSHGTGDVFASVFAGALLKGKTVYESVKTAADFVLECIRLTSDDESHWYGVKFEPLLPLLINMINDKE